MLASEPSQGSPLVFVVLQSDSRRKYGRIRISTPQVDECLLPNGAGGEGQETR